MSQQATGRVPVEIKTILTVGGVLAGLVTTWATFKSDVAAQGRQLSDQKLQLAQLDEEQEQARMDAAVLNTKVDTLTDQLSDVQVEQKAQSAIQQQMQKQLYELTYGMQQVLEEVKKP